MNPNWNRALIVSVIASLLGVAAAWGYDVQQVLRHRYLGFDGLDNVTSVAISNDGRHVYAAGLSGLVVALRDPDTGFLAALQSLDAESEYGVFSMSALALSPDGRHLYGAGTLSRSIVVFSRDVDTGLLSPVQTIENSDTDADLRGIQDVFVAPDGGSVYFAATTGSELSTFARDVNTGALELVDQDDFFTSPPLRSPSRLDIPSDGAHLYAASSDSIFVLQPDEVNGRIDLIAALTPGELAPLTQITDLVFDPSGTVAYVVGFSQLSLNDETRGTVARLLRDPATGLLTVQGVLQDVDESWHLDTENRLLLGLDPGGGVESFYVTSGYSPNAPSSLSAFEVSSDGTLSHLQTLTHAADNAAGWSRWGQPAVSPDGRHLYVPADVDQELGIWQRAADDTLSQVDSVEDGRGVFLDGLDDPYYLVAPPDGSDVYVLGWDNEAVVQYEREPDGSLIADQAIDLRSLVGPDPGEIRHLTASPNGRYALAWTDLGVVLLFERTGAGELIFLSVHDLGVILAEAELTADNRFLFVSDGNDDLWGYEITPGTGQLTLRHHVQRFGDPAFDALAVDPSGRHLYAGGSFGNEVQILRYDLDATTAEPVFVESVDVEGGIGRVFWELVLTVDGRHLLAVSSGSTFTGGPGVVVFARNPVTGELTEIQRLQDGVDGLERFRRPRELTVSADGSRVALNTDGTLSILKRDTDSGELSLLEQKVAGAPGEPSDLLGRGRLAFGPEGDQLYMPSLVQNSLTVWGADTPSCFASNIALCLGPDDRFRVEVTWRDFAGETGFGNRVTESPDSGLFWFFDPANWEMLVKVVDGCDFNGHFWVFSAATTNVAYTLTVTDTDTGEVATYENPLGTSAAAVTDTEALAVCP